MDKVAVITAGGSGMGAAAARKLAADGYRVAILSSSGKGEALATALGGVGITGSNQSADDVQRLVDATLARWGRIDVLVNSAGHGPRGPLLEITDQDWHLGMEVYFLSAVRPIRAVTPVMQAGGGGAIINISSRSGMVGIPGAAAYAASKAAIRNHTKSVALYCAAQGLAIRCNSIHPAAILTPMWEPMLGDGADRAALWLGVASCACGGACYRSGDGLEPEPLAGDGAEHQDDAGRGCDRAGLAG